MYLLDHQLKGLLNVGEGKPPHYKERIPQLETALTISWRHGRDMIQRIVQKIKIINKKIIYIYIYIYIYKQNYTIN